MKFRTNNLNGFSHVLSNQTFDKRAMQTFKLYSNEIPPAVWALQEVPTGGQSQHCIKQLQSLALRHGYTMIMPEKTWKVSKHPKSIQSVLLLKGAKNIEVFKLDDSIGLYSRYNYVKAELEGKEYYILNIHAPQTVLHPGHKENDGYVRWRMHLAKQFYTVLKEEIRKLVASGKRVVLLGDFNKNLKQPEVKELIDLGLLEDITAINNTYFCSGNNTADSVDHILVSQNIAHSSAKGRVDIDFVKVHKLSDHATVDLDLAI